jgi:hypothetical protein
VGVGASVGGTTSVGVAGTSVGSKVLVGRTGTWVAFSTLAGVSVGSVLAPLVIYATLTTKIKILNQMNGLDGNLFIQTLLLDL